MKTDGTVRTNESRQLLELMKLIVLPMALPLESAAEELAMSPEDVERLIAAGQVIALHRRSTGGPRIPTSEVVRLLSEK